MNFERLTKYIGKLPACPISRNGKMISSGEIVDRLAAYEDTELSSDEISSLKDSEHSQLAKLLAENGTLKRRLDHINDKAVSFHEDGQFEPDEALRRVMEIYNLSNVEESK